MTSSKQKIHSWASLVDFMEVTDGPQIQLVPQKEAWYICFISPTDTAAFRYCQSILRYCADI